MAEKHKLEIELECTDLPAETPPGLAELRLGVQIGQEVEQDAVCPAQQIIFRFAVQVDFDPGGAPNFSGKAVHGPRGERFLYLCWGERADGKWHGDRRAKLPLKPVTRGMVEAALQTGLPLRARIRLTDAKGRPAAATLKPEVYEWTV